MAAAIPVVVNNLYDPSKTYTGYQMRNVLHSAEREGLRILVCAHNKDDAFAAIKLLDISNPTENNPLSICGLYLEELVGGSTPFLLSHQLGQKVSSFRGTRWQPVINVFARFKSLHLRSSHVHIFTTISPPKLMHEYICWVAFDKSVSLIILPFHKKWNARGNIILNSRALRILNRNVIEKAPCSMGILIDRSRIRSKFPILVGRRREIDSPLTSGLSEFCELPELGFVGVLLASSDINNLVSVLVVQQQIIRSE